MKATFVKELTITESEIETIKKGLKKLEEFMDKTDDLELELFEEWELNAVSRWLQDVRSGALFLDDNITIEGAE